MENKRHTGSCYEDQAAAFLQSAGMQILARNFRCRTGEIDLIGLDSEALAFIEVKGRKNSYAGYPAEAVTRTKQNTIRRTAEIYLLKNGYSLETRCRFDVISICGSDITYLKNAF